ncbi:FtsQ-type POTRA domain-containing protein [bacterium]|nr:FtsQ-type POTRA domain-containing protein [bacterium]
MRRRNKIYFRYRRKKRVILNSHRGLDFVLILIFIFVLGWFLFKTPYFSIKKADILKDSCSLSSCFNTGVDREIKKFIDKRNNFFLLNLNELSYNIKSKFPWIREVEVKKKFPDAVLIRIINRKPVAIFCQKEDSCFLLSEDGVIFSSFKEEESKKELVVIFSSGEKTFRLGQRVIEEDVVSNLIFLNKELKKLEISLKKVEISPFEIRAETDKNFKILFSKNTYFRKQIEILIKTLQKIISKQEQEHLQYIDLRGVEEGGRIYWK